MLEGSCRFFYLLSTLGRAQSLSVRCGLGPLSPSLTAPDPKGFKRSLCYFQGDPRAACWYLHRAYKEFHTKRRVFKIENLQISVR